MLHSNSLFHFTNKEGLIGILTNNFQPRFSKETFSSTSSTFSYFIPMCCFCDIPLSQVEKHMNKYGKYGLGMKRTWVEEKKLNPVHYIQMESNFYNYFKQMDFRNNLIGPKINNNEMQQDFINDMSNHMTFVFTHFKPYNHINKKSGQDYSYYDEREWRYVPTEIMKNPNIIYNWNLLEDKEKLKELNENYKEYSLEFTPTDIAYIVIESDAERLEIIHKIKEIKSPKYPNPDALEVLISKIISAEQIIQDMYDAPNELNQFAK